MSPFRFRLQRILELRTKQEQSLAEELGRALERSTQAHGAHASLDAVRKASAEQFAAAHSGRVTVGQMQNLGYVIEQLDEYLTIAGSAAQDAAAKAEGARADLVAAHQARRTLDRLRDRRLAEWTSAASREDQNTTDDFSLTRVAMANSPLQRDR
ncbi:hypothetical protein BH09GEM1_BH09GEM1_12270 [soil metagenome]